MALQSLSASLAGARVSARRIDVDWARGLAVLIMIHAHVLDAWTHPFQRSTTAFQYLNVLAGFAAPLFLWLAGVALVLSGERLLAKGEHRSAASDLLIGRGLQIFILAFAFRLLLFLGNPGGSPLSIFRVDILNVMGPAMAVAGLLWRIIRAPPARTVTFAVISAGIALATPVVRDAAWVDAIPVWMQWYMRPTGEHTVFTLFPWSGFVFAGAAAGSLVARCHAVGAERRTYLALGAAGVCLIGGGFYAATLPGLYQWESFWSGSPAYFAVRLGVLMLGGAALHGLAAVAVPRGVLLKPLERLGRASLFIYAVHIPLVYGWMTARFRHHLPVWQTVCAFAAFSFAMYAMLPVRDRLVHSWFERGRPGDTGRRRSRRLSTHTSVI